MIAVIQFGGSNCDRDVVEALDRLGIESELIWYKDNFDGYDGAVIPGGFSYGDYLRAGAIAAREPIMEDIKALAMDGKPVLGICNGAQILSECGLVDGAFTVNLSAKFQCEWTTLRVESTDSPFTSQFKEGDIIDIPIAHGEGRYIKDEEKQKPEVILKYTNDEGEVTDDANPNGSMEGIAGVLGENRNVAAMMPHPERASREILGSDDGLKILEGFAREARS